MTKAKTELDVARQALVAGTGDAAQVTGAQSTYTALSEALAGVDSQLEALRVELASAQDAEQERAKEARLTELRLLMASTQSNYDALREEAAVALQGFAEKIIELRTTYANASREVGSLRGGERAWTRHEMRYSPMPHGSRRR